MTAAPLCPLSDLGQLFRQEQLSLDDDRLRRLVREGFASLSTLDHELNPPGSFRITVLRAPGKRLTKAYTAGPKKLATDKAASFHVERRLVSSPQAFFAFLEQQQHRPDACIIRGAPGPWFPRDRGTVYRLLHAQAGYADTRGRRVTAESVVARKRQTEIGETLFHATALPMFVEEATPWVLLDFDGIEGELDWREHLSETADWLKLKLPDEFADASCWYQATSSAADLTKPSLGGTSIRMRLAFVLSRPLTQSQLEAWLGKVRGLDPSTLRTVQEIYTARPVFLDGLDDPMPVRSGVLEGLEDVVEVPDELPAASTARAPGYTPAAGEHEGNGQGLYDYLELDEELARFTSDAGRVRKGLNQAASVYVRAIGREHVDVEALSARLAEEAGKYRSADEVAAHGIPRIVRWHRDKALPRVEIDVATLTANGKKFGVTTSDGQPLAWDAADPGPEYPAEYSTAYESLVPALPDFGSVEADRDAALARMRGGLAGSIQGAAERIALRRELKERQDATNTQASGDFMAEVGKAAELLDEVEKRKLKAAKSQASRAAKLAFLAEHGLEEMPARRRTLYTGGQGTGKTRTVARELAGLGEGNVTVLVPTLAKAVELAEEIAGFSPRCMAVCVWRGRTAPIPGYEEPAQGPRSAAGIDFNRPVVPRMCGRPKEIIARAQAAGCEMYKTFCKACPMRADCLYVAQLDQLKALDGACIVIATHETAFLPMPFDSDLVVIDEDLASKAARTIEVNPDRLLDPEKWQDAEALAEVPPKIAAAMAQSGRELATLREAGIDAAELRAAAGHLHKLREVLIEAIAEAGQNGASEKRLGGMIEELEAAEYGKVQMLLANLRDEICTERPGTNATRLLSRRKVMRGPDGQENEEWLPRYVISRPRSHNLAKGTEMILLDGTGSLALNQHVFGEDVEERRHAVARRGFTMQVVSNSNSKRRLLRQHPDAEKARGELRQLIGNLAEIMDDSLLVGATKKLQERLKQEGAHEDITVMHFGAERGMNSAENLDAVLVVGREQMDLATLEDMARGFALTDGTPFVSVLDDKEEGELVTMRRRRRMRDGSEVWGNVKAHPDPIAQALLEQVREAGVVQMADRVRAVWHERFIVIATDLPVDLDVDLLVTRAELARAAREAAATKRLIRERGWWVRVEPAQRGGEVFGRTTAETLISILLGFRLLFAQFSCVVPSGRHLIPAWLLTRLPLVEALREAGTVHRGLRLPPPKGGVLRECLRRHGVIGTWSDLPALVPELAPDEVAVAAIKDAEQDMLESLKAECTSAPYRVPGRRGRAGTVLWDPARVRDPAVSLSRLLAAIVTVNRAPELAKDPAPRPAVVVPLHRPHVAGECVACGDPAPLGAVLCEMCTWLTEPAASRKFTATTAGGWR